MRPSGNVSLDLSFFMPAPFVRKDHTTASLVLYDAVAPCYEREEPGRRRADAGREEGARGQAGAVRGRDRAARSEAPVLRRDGCPEAAPHAFELHRGRAR